ncbi:hypothetical protein C0993_001404, partial [Termitomyces sp. T159_Od127]
MRRRGIHNVFHASLLRMYKPNDNQLFPGCLDEQIVNEESQEWVTDKIIAHKGTHPSVMFEVLWKAGDRTWMSYEQVVDLEILTPYLDLLGIESIAKLPAGVGALPPDDPQTYLGNIRAEPLKSEGGLTCGPSRDLLNIPLSSIHLSVIDFSPSMPLHRSNRGCGGRHSYHCQGIAPHGKPYDKPSSPKHPWIHQNKKTQMIHIIPPDREPEFILHPLQMEAFLKFNKKVCKNRGCTKLATHFGFNELADVFNSVSESEYRYQLATYNPKTKRWNVPAHRAESSHIHTCFVNRKHYHKLITFSLITEQGNVDPIMLKTTLAAINQPHFANSSKTYFYQYHCDKRKERDDHDSDSEESGSESSEEEDNLDNNSYPGRSPSPGNRPPPPISAPKSGAPATPCCCPAARSADTVIRNSRGSPVVRTADSTILDNRYTPDSPRATCNPTLLTCSGDNEDVLMKNIDATKITKEFFNFNAAQ